MGRVVILTPRQPRWPRLSFSPPATASPRPTPTATSRRPKSSSRPRPAGKLEQFTPVEGMRLERERSSPSSIRPSFALEREQLAAQREAAGARRTEVGEQLQVLEVAAGDRPAHVRAHATPARAAGRDGVSSSTRRSATTARSARRSQAMRAQRRSVGLDAASTDAHVAQIRDRIGRSSVANPQAGTVLTVYARAGEVVQSGQPLYKIADLDTLELRAYVTGSQLTSVRLGQRLPVRVDGGNGDLLTVPGTVSWVSSTAEFTPTPIQTRDERADLVYAVKVRVPNQNGAAQDRHAGRHHAGGGRELGRLALEVEGLGSASRRPSRSRRSPSRSGRASCSASSGPDGAGKTTLFRILTTLLVPDRGTADGARPRRRPRPVGHPRAGRLHAGPLLAVPRPQRGGEPALLRLGLRDHASRKATTLIAPIYRQIEPFRDRRAGALSGGMKQKLALSLRPRAPPRHPAPRRADHRRGRGLAPRVLGPAGGAAGVGPARSSSPRRTWTRPTRCDRVALMQRGPHSRHRRAGGDRRAVPAARCSPCAARDRYRVLAALRDYRTRTRVYPSATSCTTPTRAPAGSRAPSPTRCATTCARAASAMREVAPIRAGIEDTFMALMGTPAEIGA